MNKVATITLELFSKYSIELFNLASAAIANKSILVVEDLSSRSFMTPINSIHKGFCVVDKNDSPDTLAHEIEHLNEYILGYKIPTLYDELGPITFETLFIDEMVDSKIPGAELLYFNRLRTTSNYLEDLCGYYKAILYAKKYNFNMSDSKFILMMNEIMSIEKKYIIEFLSEEYNNNTFFEELIYIISFIKSIDIRNKMLDDKKKGLKELKKCLNASDISFNEKKYYESVKRYIKEINRKK